ncbi:hypothetical protein ABZW30_10840 [Kitasatospora sp. NPDC004669]|uniref:hypothetical protein n=1 Tax=Kitasatospora sp. NPDC004669 TaxID=3154555 RepID=UPI0033AFE03B
MRSAWQHFDAATLADSIAEGRREFKEGSQASGAGQAPMPPIDHPELAPVLSSVPDAPAGTGGDLYAVTMNVACAHPVNDRDALRSGRVGNYRMDRAPQLA